MKRTGVAVRPAVVAGALIIVIVAMATVVLVGPPAGWGPSTDSIPSGGNAPPDVIDTALAPVTDASAEECRACHEVAVRDWGESAHALDSRVATPASVRGSFGPPGPALAADVDQWLVMERTGDELRQTLFEGEGADRRRLRSERFAIVIGATKGQTYLYWGDGVLRQLPASYLAEVDRWVYSPGFADGEAFFDREVGPDCLVCHATSLRLSEVGRVHQADPLLLGIGCARCHGDASEHARARRAGEPESVAVSPVRVGGLDRERRLALCGQCHSGTTLGARTTAPFSFRPGDRLEDHYRVREADLGGEPEVHANQVALLAASACFRMTRDMTCSTCHDPHRAGPREGGRNVRCIGCHEALAAAGHGAIVARDRGAEGTSPVSGDEREDCVGCHMPVAGSLALSVESQGRRIALPVRTHRIAVY